MSDLQTEMQKILQAWEQPETTEQPTETTMFKSTNNVSKDTFNSVRDFRSNPARFHIDRLVRMGHKKSSVSSLLGQMIRQGHIYKDSSDLLQPNATEYTPLKAAKTITNREKKVKPAKTLKLKTSKAEAKGIDALVTEPMNRDHDAVKHIMNTLSLPDAKRLYNCLATYFGTP